MEADLLSVDLRTFVFGFSSAFTVTVPDNVAYNFGIVT